MYRSGPGVLRAVFQRIAVPDMPCFNRYGRRLKKLAF